MKKWIKVLIWIAGIIAVLTVLFNFLSLKLGAGCTLMGCPCQSWTRAPGTPHENLTGERPCNTCFLGNPVFVSIVFNLVRHCEYKQIIICENGAEVGQRYDKENKVCRYDPYFLMFNLRYFGQDMEAISSNQPAIQVNGTSFPRGE
ncbi:MAG: hypothetical protein KKD18_03530 [Nanoarchaeota archaeon]|nr:hypothetical protein [Nanoarchaeota archaeon]